MGEERLHFIEATMQQNEDISVNTSHTEAMPTHPTRKIIPFGKCPSITGPWCWWGPAKCNIPVIWETKGTAFYADPGATIFNGQTSNVANVPARRRSRADPPILAFGFEVLFTTFQFPYRRQTQSTPGRRARLILLHFSLHGSLSVPSSKDLFT